jgi:hypothetical protein
MDTYITKDPCENDLLTDSKKAYINFKYFYKWKDLQLSIGNRQERIRTDDSELTFNRRGNIPQS